MFTADYFIEKFSVLEFDDPFSVLDYGEQWEFKKPIGVNEYESIMFPEVGSEYAEFRDLIWDSTWESPYDVVNGKCKKFKFLNDIADVKSRTMAMLQFIKNNGKRSQYWDKGENREMAH